MVDPVDQGFAGGHQPGYDEARGGAQVGRHDARPLQALDAVYDGGVAFEPDVGAEALHLERVHEAVLEMVSVITAVPRATVASAMNCACMSVANPGCGAVRTLTAFGRSDIRISIESALVAILAPASRSLSSVASSESGAAL